RRRVARGRRQPRTDGSRLLQEALETAAARSISVLPPMWGQRGSEPLPPRVKASRSIKTPDVLILSIQQSKASLLPAVTDRSMSRRLQGAPGARSAMPAGSPSRPAEPAAATELSITLSLQILAVRATAQ